ncbi:MAG: HNH endonuclease domain-containing protein [Verrucomicrobiota bacterium]
MSTMKYSLEMPPHPAGPVDWKAHPFYKSAVVLGIDIGIEGIGLWLRKGPKPIFAHTFRVSLPVSAPLKNRRQKRASRHARKSRKRRERRLQEWIVRHGLLAPERLTEKWNNPSVFERAFEHRLRAINGKLASPEALVVCLRHIVKLRGYDYHLTEDGKYPWGDELEFKAIINWAEHAYCSPDYRTSLLTKIDSDAAWAKDENGRASEKLLAVKAKLETAVKNYDSQPIERMLENHNREKGHPNLRESARGSGNNFPRELVWEHLHKICDRHRDYFPQREASFEIAMEELKKVLDYHRRTPEEAEELWLRKTKICPFAEKLHSLGKVPLQKIKCALRSDFRVRRFNLVMFLAERRLELANHERVNVRQEIVKALLNDLEKDDVFVKAVLEKAKAPPPRPDKPGKHNFEARFKLQLAGVKEGSLNKSFFDQLADLIRPELRSFRDRASLSGESAEALFQISTKENTSFEPEGIKESLRKCGYYDWRKNQDRGLGFYPQVEFLVGQRKHYTDEGAPRDAASADPKKKGNGRNDGQPQHHGILRKLFAGQLRLDDGSVVNLAREIGDSAVPDFVVLETIGDIPSHLLTPKENEKKKKKQASNRAFKLDLIEKYGLLDSSNENLLKRAKVYNQQVVLKKNPETKKGEAVAICPYTGREIGALVPALQIEHIFPESLGGISVVENLAITTKEINQAKGKSAPFEVAGKTINGVKFLDWPSMRALASKFGWSRQKFELFCREESDCPQWDNTTRMAQLARHLRTEVIHWLGLNRIADETERSKKIAEKIGTPSGFLTSVCRDTWTPPSEFPKMYREITDKQGRARWVKNRDNLRHHLWDAAVLSHIPPGVGMNSTSCGGVFVEERDSETGGFKTSALPGLGPDLSTFEKDNASRCLVSKPRQAKSKKSRYKEMIYGLADSRGVHFVREPLAKLAAKQKREQELRKMLDRPGLLKPLEVVNKKTGEKRSIQLLRDSDVEHWLVCKDISLDQKGFRDFLTDLGVPQERITDAAVKEQFVNKQTNELRVRSQFQAKHIIAFLRKKLAIPETEISDLRVEEVFRARMERATLRSANGLNGLPGQKILSIPVKQACQQFYGPHFNPTAPKKNNLRIAGFKAIDNSNSVIYLRREIWIGQRIKKKGRQSVAQTFYEHRLIPHPRHLCAYEKVHGRKWTPEPLPKGMILAGSLSVGDLLRIPLKKEKRNSSDNLIAKRGEGVLDTHFYRVKSLLTEGKVEFQLAEYNEPRVPKDKRPDAATQRLLDIFELSSSREEDLIWLLEITSGKPVPPPAPVLETTSEKQAVPPDSFL